MLERMTGFQKDALLAALVPIIPVGMLFFSVRTDLTEFRSHEPFVETVGHVARLDCQNHGEYQASFNFEGRELIVNAGNLYLREDCGALRAGQQIPVWYSKRDPGYASFVLPDWAIGRMNRETTAMLVFPYPIFFFFILIGQTLKRRMSGSTPPNLPLEPTAAPRESK